ncbi:hypothetical protein L2747_17330 [Shewanella marinintestina]|uniref:hypothetical protein n=1 Tax=Shewanella marinintestina TaxID=190305 RepID=UPI00200BD917|nr:hypothetical protein [Shewanella marinintestina]MCL1147771.1 hypothetical protein [Shewanella marinintestina]
MDLSAPKFLFLPVSSAEGCGEYMRSLIIADGIMDKWPNATIQFAISQEASYATECPYFTHILKDTPTKLVDEVNALVSDFKPDVVVFDASGRKAQMQHAKTIGAKVVFISQHKRKRARGMKIGRAKVTDSHWVAQPEFVIGPISWLDKQKLQWTKCAEPIVIGSVFTAPDLIRKNELLTMYGLQNQDYILFNAGSGGHKAATEFAADVFWTEANKVAQQTGMKCVMVFGSNYPYALPTSDSVITIKSLANQDFISLLEGAKIAVLSGGDTLLQAISLVKPVVAVAVSKDQPKRIKICVKHNLVVSSQLNENISEKTMMLLNADNLPALPALVPSNGLELALKELSRLLA